MYQDDEVFSFSITFGKTNKIEVLEKLNHFDKAPYGINENTSMEDEKEYFLDSLIDVRLPLAVLILITS